jgi:hypothetical protein
MPLCFLVILPPGFSPVGGTMISRVSVVSVAFSILCLGSGLWPVALQAQSREEDSRADSGDTTSGDSSAEPGQTSGSVKFRGFRSATATEDLPNMMDDWKVSFFQLASLDMARFDDQQPVGLFSYNFLSFNYKLTDDSRVALRPAFILESPGTSGTGGFTNSVGSWKTRWDNWYFQYSKFDLFDFGPFGTRMNFRVYAPTSQRSKDTGLITIFRPELYLETSFRRGTGLEIGLRGEYHVQSRRTVLTTNSQGFQRASGNVEAEQESYIEINQKLTSKLNLRPRFTWFDEWRYGSRENNVDSRHVSRLTAALGFDWRPSEKFNTVVQFANQTTYFSNRSYIRKGKYFDPNNNQLVFISNYRF